jgi:cold shock CspA family protein
MRWNANTEQLRGITFVADRYNKRESGTVKRYFADRNERMIGFIQPDLGGLDVFFSKIALDKAGINTLEAGDRVSYESRIGKMGKPQAWNLNLIEHEQQKA